MIKVSTTGILRYLKQFICNCIRIVNARNYLSVCSLASLAYQHGTQVGFDSSVTAVFFFILLLQPENVLVDRKGNIKISDFGLSALPQHLGNDGLLHTTCGSPNYIAPEVLQNRGYDGSLSDIWSCGVILYVMLVGYLPFDDRNLVVLYQKIFKGDCQIPKWLSPAAQDLLRKILEPNPMKRINITGIKEHEWFKKDYVPAVPYDDDEDLLPSSVLPIKEPIDESAQEKPTHINAFQLIGMASSLDLSGFFEEEVCICTVSFHLFLLCHPDPDPKLFCTVQLTS
jgi:serine/threonine protein kinase